MRNARWLVLHMRLNRQGGLSVVLQEHMFAHLSAFAAFAHFTELCLTVQMVQMGAEHKVVPCKTRKTGNDLKTTHAILLHDPEAQDNGRGNASQLVWCIKWLHVIGLPLFCHVSRWPRERGYQAVGLCLFVARSLRCHALE